MNWRLGPAGCLLVEGSLRHNADRVERTGNRLRLRYGPGTIEDISYDVIALTPGVWPVRAAEIADPYDPARCRRGVAGVLTVLAPGAASPDAYQMNRAEHLELARLRFAQNKGAECLGHLDALARGTCRSRPLSWAAQGAGSGGLTCKGTEERSKQLIAAIISSGGWTGVSAAAHERIRLSQTTAGCQWHPGKH